LLVPGLSVEVTVDTSSAKDEIERLRDEQRKANRQER
jgi:membrane fusion protein (multidrug efflux system)